MPGAKSPIRVLLLEDERTDAELIMRELKRAALRAQTRVVCSEEDFRAQLAGFLPDVILSDFTMPGFDGMFALSLAHELSPDIPFIFVSGTIGEEYAVRALKNGATDYVLKSNLVRLPAAVERALQDARERAQFHEIERALQESEAGLRRAQLMAGLAHVVTRPDGSFESWSENLPALIGMQAVQMPKSTREWLDFVHPEDHDGFRAKALEGNRSGKRIELAYRFRRADGSWMHVDQVSEPLDGGHDVPGKRRWFGTLRDVTDQRRAEAVLRESEARFRSLIELSSDFYWETDAEHRMVSTRHGPDHKPIVGAAQHGLRRWESPSTRPDAAGWAAHRATLDARKPFLDFEIARIDPSGVERHLSLSGEPVFDASGAFKGYRGIGKDITERKRTDEKVKRLSRVHAVLSGINALIVRVQDRDELFRGACRIAVEQAGFPLAWIGMLDADSQHLKAAAMAGSVLEYGKLLRPSVRADIPAGQGTNGRAFREGRPIVENDMAANPDAGYMRSEGIKYGIRAVLSLPLLVEGSPVGVMGLYAKEKGYFDDEETKLFTELASEFAFALDHIEKSNKLDYLAYYDALTGLANRSLLLERLTQSIRLAGPGAGKLALVVADIERFRSVNESLGRQAGDAVIMELARRLTRVADRSELARIGGDHFAIVLPAVKGRSDTTRRVERIWHECLREAFMVDETELRVSARGGIALFPRDGGDADTLLRNAESAQRKAKDLSERHVFYTSALTERTAGQLTLENRLRQALEKEEFVLHYQPKVDLDTRRIVGVEALIRWQSPELGLVPPGKFIPLMEETGLILEVGSWALQRAAIDHRAWVEQRIKTPRVAVNVSAIQLRQRGFVGAVEQAIIEGVAPTGIDLEITESLVMEDVQGNIAKLKAVRALGVSIAIDDFGTGYSSLGYLAKLPVQTLKIDRSFIVAMLNDPDTMTLVSTIISLAHSLRLKVVAEGVETEDQAKMLRLLRCDEMQGYLFSRPVTFEQMTSLLKQEEKPGIRSG